MEENRIISNINSLVMMLRSKGVQHLSATKLLLFINKAYGLSLEQDDLESILNKNSSVVSLDGDKITIGEPEVEDDEEEASDAVHDMAVDAAADNMTQESYDLNALMKLYEGIKVGQEIDSKNVILKETDDSYFINRGVQKAHGSYVITKLNPSKTVENSTVTCKVLGESLFVTLPVISIEL